MKKNAGHLHRHEWEFDKVPDSELVACCYWEYARESAFVRSVVRRLHEHVKRGGGRLGNKLDADLQTLERGVDELQLMLGGISRDACPFLNPWQSCFARPCPGADVSNPYHDEPFRRAPWFYAREMVRLEGDAKYRESIQRDAKLLFSIGHEIALFQIDWAKFTKKEIANSMARWVRKNHRPDVAEPRKRGKKQISNRVNLERLAIMRLLRCYSLPELRTECPEAWERYDSANRRWSRDATRARAVFGKLFAFLGDVEPLSWPPKP